MLTCHEKGLDITGDRVLRDNGKHARDNAMRLAGTCKSKKGKAAPRRERSEWPGLGQNRNPTSLNYAKDR